MNSEEENTFRALREEPLLVTRFWCRFGFHRWTKWSHPIPKFSGSSYARQERECVGCGEYAWKEIKYRA